MEGKIYEILVYDTALDASTRGDIETHLMDKWGI
jgi:hypothetical protein